MSSIDASDRQHALHIMAHAHRSVQSIAAANHSDGTVRVYTTPRVYLELVHVVSMFYGRIRENTTTTLGMIRRGLDKLESSASEVTAPQHRRRGRSITN